MAIPPFGAAPAPNVIVAGSVGSSTQIPVITYNKKGAIVSVTTATPTVTASIQRTFAFFAG